MSKFVEGDIVQVRKGHTTGYPWSDGKKYEYCWKYFNYYGEDAGFSIVKSRRKVKNPYIIIPTDWLRKVKP